MDRTSNVKNISCDVIRDLLPSYVDQVCSQDTKVLVREHIAECGSCRQKLERMQDTEIVSDKLQEREVDYLKKFRKERAGAIMLCAIALVKMGLPFFFTRMGNINLERGFSAGLTLMLLFAVGVAGNYKVTVEKGKMIKEILLAAALFLLQAGMNEYVMVYCLPRERKPFLIEPNRVGPMITLFCVIVMAAAGLLLLKQALSEHKNAYAAALSVAGLNLAGATIKYLYLMEEFASLRKGIHLEVLIQLIFIAAAMIVLSGYFKWAAKRES